MHLLRVAVPSRQAEEVLEGEVRRPHLFPARDSTAVSATTRPQAARDPEPALGWSKEASRHGVAPMACTHNSLAELATVALVPDAAGPSEETGRSHAAAARQARRSMRRSPGLWALVDRGRLLLARPTRPRMGG